LFELRYTLVLGLGIAIGLSSGLAAHARPQRGRRPPGPPPRENPVVASQREADAAVQRAYDALERSTVLSQIASGGTTDMLRQGRDGYQQALSRYQASNFGGARETARAATALAHAAEHNYGQFARSFHPAVTTACPPTGSAAILPMPSSKKFRDPEESVRVRISSTPPERRFALGRDGPHTNEDASKESRPQKRHRPERCERSFPRHFQTPSRDDALALRYHFSSIRM
jgi:hypothetical protein